MIDSNQTIGRTLSGMFHLSLIGLRALKRGTPRVLPNSS
jgi:hypothetical protein